MRPIGEADVLPGMLHYGWMKHGGVAACWHHVKGIVKWGGTHAQAVDPAAVS